MGHDRKVLTPQLNCLLLSYLAVSFAFPKHIPSKSLF